MVDVNVMARRALKDEMPGMVFRGVTRAIVKGVLQDQLEKNAGMFGAIVGMVGSAVTEQADDRMWRTLPGRVYVTRGYLPEGRHRVTIAGKAFDVDVAGQYALVPVRLYGDMAIVGDVGKFGRIVAQPPAPVAEPVVPAAVQAPAQTKPVRKVPPAKKPALVPAPVK